MKYWGKKVFFLLIIILRDDLDLWIIGDRLIKWEVAQRGF